LFWRSGLFLAGLWCARVDGKVEEREELGQLETLSGQRELIPAEGRNAGLDTTSSDSN